MVGFGKPHAGHSREAEQMGIVIKGNSSVVFPGRHKRITALRKILRSKDGDLDCMGDFLLA